MLFWFLTRMALPLVSVGVTARAGKGTRSESWRRQGVGFSWDAGQQSDRLGANGRARRPAAGPEVVSGSGAERS